MPEGDSRPLLERAELRLRVRTTLVRFVRETEAVLGSPPPQDLRSRVQVVGSDPIRVLVCGGGVCTGLGMRSFADAVDGALAAELAERTGRGVVVENRTGGLDVETADVERSLGAVGTHTYDLVLLGLSFTEVVRTVRRRAIADRVAALVGRLQADRAVPVVVVPVPLVVGMHPMAVLARAWTAGVNRLVERAVARLPDAAVSAATPTAVRDPGTTVLAQEHYAHAGAAAVDAYLDLRSRRLERLG